MKNYELTLKNGIKHLISENVDKNGELRSPIGLWIWSLKQYTPQVLSYGRLSVLSTEILAIEEIEGEQ